MNVIVQLEYELAYYDSAVQRFNHYTMRTPPGMGELKISTQILVPVLSHLHTTVFLFYIFLFIYCLFYFVSTFNIKYYFIIFWQHNLITYITEWKKCLNIISFLSSSTILRASLQALWFLHVVFQNYTISHSEHFYSDAFLITYLFSVKHFIVLILIINQLYHVYYKKRCLVDKYY